MDVEIYVDGGSRGNPGPGAVGVVVKPKLKEKGLEDKAKKLFHKFGKRIGYVTNNEAEYRAIIEGLTYLREKINRSGLKIAKVDIFLDSKLVYNQLRGVYKMKNPRLRELFFRIKIIEQEIKVPLSYFLIPREKNREADREVNKALDYKELIS